MIHKEGYVIIAVSFAALALIYGGVYFLHQQRHLAFPLHQIALGVCILLFVFILQFFRNPKVNSPQDERLILSPAYGKVISIEETMENEFYHEKMRKVSIFMPPYLPHMNRNPIGGKVMYEKYYSGSHLVAWHPKSSDLNEHTVFAVENNKTKILVKQIAGIVARRVVYYIHAGDSVRAGEDFGFIKFGSRTDLFFPLNAEVKVKIGERVNAGETVVAREE